MSKKRDKEQTEKSPYVKIDGQIITRDTVDIMTKFERLSLAARKYISELIDKFLKKEK